MFLVPFPRSGENQQHTILRLTSEAGSLWWWCWRASRRHPFFWSKNTPMTQGSDWGHCPV
jgi:hypothetical protein